VAGFAHPSRARTANAEPVLDAHWYSGGTFVVRHAYPRRATEVPMHPSVPRPIRVMLVLATIASLLAIPSVASAAPKGSGIVFTVTSLNTAVSPNMAAAFEVFVRNDGSATLTHATVTVEASGAVTSRPAECSAALVCDLGTLSSGSERTLLFVVTAPSAGSATLTARLQVDAGSGNPSQDAGTRSAATSVNQNAAFFGTWHGANAALTGAIASGHQTASVSVPAVSFAYPAELSEASGKVCGQQGIGQAIDMQLANGQSVLPNLLTVTVTYDATARGNRTPGNVGFVHQADNGDCTTLVKGCLTAGCFNAFWDGNGPDKKLVVVALLASNGLGKGL
jgi:hypothetical protein